MTIFYSIQQRFILVLALLFYGATVNAATLTSTVNRNSLSSNETLTLTVTSDVQVNSSLLDLSPLNSDFQVLGSSPQSSSSISSINGKTTTVASTVWTITLVPKREGELVIPAFTVNNAQSKPITITVDNSKQVNSADQPLQAWVVASGNEIYPSQQLIIDVELSAARDIRDLNGSPLLINGAEVESLGQQTFQRVDNGIARQIVSLKYAVFAKEAGEITIPIMTFTGVQGGQRSFFGNRGTQVVARTEQMTIAVLQAPTNKSYPWFPAENVTISSAWSGDRTALKAGAPITRTITITATGQTASAIPPLTRLKNPDELKSYKDQAQLESKPTANGFVSTRIESEALVANKSGDFTVPELTLNWWNVKSKQWQVATLSAETLNVSGSVVSNHTPIENPVMPVSIAAPKKTNWLWPSISAALALLCLIQALVIMRFKRSPESAEKPEQVNQSEVKNWQVLEKSLGNGSALDIRKALLDWARSALPNESPVTLKRLGELAENDNLSTALLTLEQNLYQGGDNFNADSLRSALQNLRTKLARSATGSKTEPSLPPLYKPA